MKDISVESLIPAELDPELSVDRFLDRLAKYDELFQKRLEKATAVQKVLRYIGSWDGQKAKVSLEMVSNDNPFYSQNGRENFFVFRSKRYNYNPLVIKGHGAGATVTAAGVLNDIQQCLHGR